MVKKKIVLTGGGTAGHVIPHIALLPEFEKRKYSVHYIGTSGIEKDLIAPLNIPFYEISAGKLRRYFSIKNFIDIFKVATGFFQSLFFLVKIRPSVIFSKGGFVSVPVCIAGALLGIPVIVHESDLTPGLANKIVGRFSKKTLYTFPETIKYLEPNSSVYVGSPVRRDIFMGNRSKGFHVSGFKESDPRPVVLIMGGSLGAKSLNEIVLKDLEGILNKYRVVHLTGKGKLTESSRDGYASFEYLGSELKDVFAITSLVVARSGANSIFEFLALRKPMILVPLEAGSRGDQIVNAQSFQKLNYAIVKPEANLLATGLLAAIEELVLKSDQIIKSQMGYNGDLVIENIMAEIEQVAL